MKMKTTRSCDKQRQSGVTMLEVLITVFILAVGLLGIAALQLMSKRSNFESVQRTTASMLAQGVIERMRANPAALNVYAGTLENVPGEITGNTYPSAPNPDCQTAPCTNSAEMAAADLYYFEQGLIGATEKIGVADNVGGLKSPIACLASGVPAALTDRSGHYRITIAWRGQTALSDPDPANTCGQASGNYDEAAGDNKFRRLLVIDTVIAE